MWALVLAALLAVGVGVAIAARPRRTELHLDPADVAELDAVGAVLLAEHRSNHEPLLANRLRTLAGRGVPASSVTPTGIRGQWVLHFADSTPLVVRERRPGDMAVLSLQLTRGRVNLASFRFVEAGAVVEVAWRSGRMRVLAVA